MLCLGANYNDRDPSRGLSPLASNLVGRHAEGDAHRAGRAWVSPRLELLQEFDDDLLVFGAQLAEAPNDLARVTPISL